MTASARPVGEAPAPTRPSRADAEAAVRTLIRWAGDDPVRPGLLDTPDRVLRSLDEACVGYAQDAGDILEAAATDAVSDELVVVRGIRFASRSDETMAPLVGDVLVAYVPDRRALDAASIGLAVDALSQRLQNPAALATLLVAAVDRAIRARGATVHVRSIRVAAMISARTIGAESAVDTAHSGVLSVPSRWDGRLASLVSDIAPLRLGPGRRAGASRADRA